MRAVAQPLDADFLLAAYRLGYFPMAEADSGEVFWYSPDPRAIIPLDSFTVSRSLRQKVRRRVFEIRVNTAFEQVIRACANRVETWISREIIDAYTELHRRGYAHSVESWDGENLVGGLYGVAVGGAFFGESMFSFSSDASKVALVHLVERLRQSGFTLLDTQFVTEHLRQFGARAIPRTLYLKLLAASVALDVKFLA